MELHVSGIIQYVLCVWLLSLSNVCVMLLHMSVVCFLLLLSSIPLYEYTTIFFIHLSASGHFGDFQFWASMDKLLGNFSTSFLWANAFISLE